MIRMLNCSIIDSPGIHELEYLFSRIHKLSYSIAIFQTFNYCIYTSSRMCLFNFQYLRARLFNSHYLRTSTAQLLKYQITQYHYYTNLLVQFSTVG